jgi:DNA-binding protein YbaB
VNGGSRPRAHRHSVSRLTTPRKQAHSLYDQPVKVELLQAIDRAGRMLQNAQRTEEMLNSKVFFGTDDDELVVATVGSDGRVLDLEIEDQALQNPRRLGERIEVSVTRGRNRASDTINRYRSQLFSESSIESTATVDAALPRRVDYQLLDYTGPERIRNRIAEALEAIVAISDEVADFQHVMVSEKVGHGLGIVEINLAETELRVMLEPGEIRFAHGPAVACAVMASLGRAGTRALEERKRKLRLADRVH